MAAIDKVEGEAASGPDDDPSIRSYQVWVFRRPPDATHPATFTTKCCNDYCTFTATLGSLMRAGGPVGCV